MKGNTTLKLLAALAVLVIVYLIMTLSSGNNRSKSFRSVLVEIDTAKVTKVEVISSGQTTVVTKVDDQWEVAVPDGVKPANASAVKNLLTSLEGAKPSRLVSRSEGQWKDYAVDSTGTRVKVYEEGDVSLDLIIGRFGVEGQRQFHTFVRLAEDEDVYQANDFMGISIAKSPDDFRNSDLLRLKQDSLTEINFNYRDSAFSLYKAGTRWVSDQLTIDSAKVAQYLQGLSFVTSGEFAADEAPGTPEMNVTYGFTDRGEIQVSAYRQGDGWVIASSENDAESFKDQAVIDKVFFGPSQLTESVGQ